MLALALTLSTTPAAVETIELHWSAPEACPDANVIRSQIERFVDRRKPRDTLKALKVDAAVHAADPGFRLTIKVSGSEQTIERAITAPSCDVLVEAAGLMIAVTLDPLSVLRTVEPAAPPLPRRPLTPALHAGAVFEGGTLPRAGFGAELAFAVGGRRWRTDLYGLYLAPRNSEPFVLNPGAGAALQLGSGGVRACALPRTRNVLFPVCGAFEAGAVRGRGSGLEVIKTSHRLWLGATVGAGMEWPPRGRWALAARVDAAFALVRPGFEVEDLGPLHRASVAAFRVFLGPRLRFP